jgi:hypothetical protein
VYKGPERRFKKCVPFSVLAHESVSLVSYLMLVYSAMKQLEKK